MVKVIDKGGVIVCTVGVWGFGDGFYFFMYGYGYGFVLIYVGFVFVILSIINIWCGFGYFFWSGVFIMYLGWFHYIVVFGWWYGIVE